MRNQLSQLSLRNACASDATVCANCITYAHFPGADALHQLRCYFRTELPHSTTTMTTAIAKNITNVAKRSGEQVVSGHDLQYLVLDKRNATK